MEAGSPFSISRIDTGTVFSKWYNQIIWRREIYAETLGGKAMSPVSQSQRRTYAISRRLIDDILDNGEAPKALEAAGTLLKFQFHRDRVSKILKLIGSLPKDEQLDCLHRFMGVPLHDEHATIPRHVLHETPKFQAVIKSIVLNTLETYQILSEDMITKVLDVLVYTWKSPGHSREAMSEDFVLFLKASGQFWTLWMQDLPREDWNVEWASIVPDHESWRILYTIPPDLQPSVAITKVDDPPRAITTCVHLSELYRLKYAVPIRNWKEVYDFARDAFERYLWNVAAPKPHIKPIYLDNEGPTDHEANLWKAMGLDQGSVAIQSIINYGINMYLHGGAFKASPPKLHEQVPCFEARNVQIKIRATKKGTPKEYTVYFSLPAGPCIFEPCGGMVLEAGDAFFFIEEYEPCFRMVAFAGGPRDHAEFRNPQGAMYVSTHGETTWGSITDDEVRKACQDETEMLKILERIYEGCVTSMAKWRSTSKK